MKLSLIFDNNYYKNNKCKVDERKRRSKTKQFLNGCLSQRIDQISQSLLKTNGEYAQADHKRKILYQNVHCLISGDTDLEITGGDRMDIKEYIEQVAIMASIEKHALYRQGYMDCVKVLNLMCIL